MAETLYTFDEDSVRRIDEHLRRFAGADPTNRLPQPDPTAFRVPRLDGIRITSTSTTGGFYPGKRYSYNETADTYTDEIDVWVKEPNGNTLSAQRYSNCRLIGVATAGGTTKPLFEVNAAAGASSSGLTVNRTRFTAISCSGGNLSATSITDGFTAGILTS